MSVSADEMGTKVQNLSKVRQDINPKRSLLAYFYTKNERFSVFRTFVLASGIMEL